jgi:hypothetical protein
LPAPCFSARGIPTTKVSQILITGRPSVPVGVKPPAQTYLCAATFISSQVDDSKQSGAYGHDVGTGTVDSTAVNVKAPSKDR